MPKFLLGIVVVKTFTTFADTDEQARNYILKLQESDSEEPESGVTATRYKLEWEEGVECANPTPQRDAVLAAILDLMQNKIPGMPVNVEENEDSKIKKEEGLIVLPFH